jgi:hypothetical protein
MGCGDVRPVFPGKRHLDWKTRRPRRVGHRRRAPDPRRHRSPRRAATHTELPVKTGWHPSLSGWWWADHAAALDIAAAVVKQGRFGSRFSVFSI